MLKIQHSPIHPVADIYALQLEKKLGHTFVKVMYAGGKKMPILRPLHIITPDYKKYDLTGIEKAPPLCYDLLPLGIPQKGPIWKKVAECAVSAKEPIPDFKNDLSRQTWNKANWKNLKSWYLVRDFFPNGWTPIKYEDAIHLGVWQHSWHDLIRTKLTMFWLKKLRKQKEILKLYAGKIDAEDFIWNRAAYYETRNLVFYSDVDPSLWNKLPAKKRRRSS